MKQSRTYQCRSVSSFFLNKCAKIGLIIGVPVVISTNCCFGSLLDPFDLGPIDSVPGQLPIRSSSFNPAIQLQTSQDYQPEPTIERLLSEERKRVRGLKKKLKNSQAQEYSLDPNIFDGDTPLSVALGEQRNEKTQTSVHQSETEDDFRGQQVADARQAIQFHNRRKQENEINTPFKSDNEAQSSSNVEIHANKKPQGIDGWEVSSSHAQQGGINGILSLPGNPPSGGGSADSTSSGGGSSTGATPSAPLYPSLNNEPPPDYDTAMQQEPQGRGQQVLIVRNGQLVYDQPLPVATNIQQAVEHTQQRHSGSNPLQHLPQSIHNLQNLGDSQAAVLEATRQLEIPVGVVSRFSALREYHLDLILDDSGSMSACDTGLSRDRTTRTQISRMEELKARLRSLTPLLAAVSVQGITVRTLSTLEPMHIPGELPIKEKEEILYGIISCLEPTSRTPLTGAVLNSFESAVSNHRQTVAYIFTDGEPTDTFNGQHGSQGFINAIGSIRSRMPARFFPIGIMACTDDENCIQWMNKLDSDQGLGNIQVMDDYFSESREVYDHHGGFFPYTPGLYVSAGLLGPIDQTLDNLDESNVFRQHELEDFLGIRLTPAEYRRYYDAAAEARRNCHRWNNGQHPVDEINRRQPLTLNGVTLYRTIDGYVHPNYPNIPASSPANGGHGDDGSCTIL